MSVEVEIATGVIDCREEQQSIRNSRGDSLDVFFVDMGSDVTLDAAISYEWESGECERHFIWQPRAEPNFVAAGHAPYTPGTGYVILDYCDTLGSTGPL